MKSRFALFAIIGIAAAGAFALQDAAKIVWKPKAGSVMKYKLSSLSNFSGQAVEFGGTMVMKTLEIKSDGKVVIKSSMENITFKMGDQDMSGGMPMDMIPTVTTVHTPDGEIVSRDLDKPSEFDTPKLENAMTFTYPKGDLKVGDTWTRKHPGDKKRGIPASETVFTYKGAEKLGDKFDTYRIDMVFKETEGGTPMTMSGTAWLKVDDGALLKAESTMKNVEIMPGTMVDMTNKIMRISAEGA